MAKYQYAVYPNRGVGFLALGSSLYDVLNTLKELPEEFTAVEPVFSATNPLLTPVLVNLPNNGLRLRFDGPEQRLRLIEVLDFTKIHLTYGGSDIFKASDTPTPSLQHAQGPTYRAVAKLFGPTFPGEYIPPSTAGGLQNGTYVLSYPGIAFSFQVDAKAWAQKKDVVSMLSSSATSPAQSMAIFAGGSWSEVRNTLFSSTVVRQRPRASSSSKREEHSDEIVNAKIHGEGRIELVRMNGSSCWIHLSQTTTQDLVTELGPPDAIYAKDDRRLSIHKARNSTRPKSENLKNDEEHGTEEDPAMSLDAQEAAAVEHFYNYFRFGFDILIAQPTPPSAPTPTMPEAKSFAVDERSIYPTNILTATKMLFHGNVPGSRFFQRYRRCQWTLEHVPTAEMTDPLTSEQKFSEISVRLKEVFSGLYASDEEAKSQQRGMTLDRGSIDSPGSSCELLGGPEEDVEQKTGTDVSIDNGQGVSNTTELFGYPGMIFEVLKSGAVCCLTVY